MLPAYLPLSAADPFITLLLLVLIPAGSWDVGGRLWFISVHKTSGTRAEIARGSRSTFVLGDMLEKPQDGESCNTKGVKI
jgi:hypothetical protein